MGTPAAPQVQPDPMLAQLMKTAQKQQIAALQSEASGDTASLMARYGARMAGSGMSPIGIQPGAPGAPGRI